MLGAPRRTLAFLVVLQIALWAQGNLFLWDYGSFDGSDIDWSENRGRGMAEAAAWYGALALALARPLWIAKRALVIAGLTTALQLGSLAGHLRDNAPFPEKRLFLDRKPDVAEHASLYSSERNVFVIVLDAFQSDFFSTAMLNDELAAGLPPSFTFYRNAISVYTRTQFSLQTGHSWLPQSWTHVESGRR